MILERQAEELELHPVGDGEPWGHEQGGKRIPSVFREDRSGC